MILSPPAVLHVVAAAAALLAQTQPEIAQSDPQASPVNRPLGAQRIVHAFDFEEQDTNPNPVPRYWVRAQEDPEHPRPGFPSWNRAELDYDVAWRGQGSLRLPTDGGSVSLLLETGVIPVFESTDYGVSVRVRTAGLAHASPTLVARFLDRASKPLAESRRSLLPSEDWREIAVEMVGNYPDAAFLQIELLLLQPEQAATGKPPEFNAWPQDFKGAAWFDDLVVTQLPRVELSAAGPGNTAVAPETPRLVGVVRDLTGEDLTIRIEVRDWRGTLIDVSERRIGVGRAAIDWSPSIKQPGWYHARLDVQGDGVSVGGTAVSFVYLPRPTAPVTRVERDPSFSADRDRFTLTLPDWPADARSAMVDLVARAGSAGATLPLWEPQLTGAGAVDAARELAAGPDPMVDRWQTPTLAITRLPDELAAALQLDPVDVWALLTADPTVWSPYLEPYLERFGQRIRRWQLGETGDATALSLPDLAARLDRAEAVIGRLTPGPILTIPIRADREIPADLIPALTPARTGVVAALPADAPPDAVAAFAQRWKQAFPADAPDLTLALLAPVEEAGPAGAADHTIALTRHVVEFWRLFDGPRPARLSLANAWEWRGQRRPQAAPRPEVAAWRNLADRLVDRRVVGELPAGEGVRCYILAPSRTAPPGRSGALVAWRESPEASNRPIRAFLGEGPITFVDPVGATRPAEIDTAGAEPGVQPAVVIPVTDEPVFVEGVDASLVRFLASVRVDPEFVICSNEQHEHAIIFENPWPVQMEGRFTIVSPGGSAPAGPRDRSWNFNPRSATFNVPPGERARIPISVAFSSATEAGEEQLVIDFQLAAARSYGTVRATARLELGLQNLRMEVRAIPAGPDVGIEATITNTGNESVTLSLTAFAPGFPRAKASVNELAPGANVIRKFHYPGGAAKLAGQRIVVGLADPEAKTHLNKSVTIE